MKHIKILGLLAVAAMAITAFVGTTTASATTKGTFSAGKVGVPLKTSKLVEHVFTVTGQQVKCNKIEFKGETEALSSPSATVTPVYQECKVEGLTATVNTEGCHYKFTATTTGNPANTNETHAPVHLEKCNAGGVTITVNIPFIAKCKILVPNQEVPDAVHYTNTTSAGGVTSVMVKVTATAVAAEVQESSGACPLTVGKHTNASYTGEQEVEAEGGISHTKE